MSTPDLFPIDFAALVARLDRELAAGGDVFLLPRRGWWTPTPGRDTSVEHLGQRIATPTGPASGPHTQLAQNIVMAWLSGARFMELKTVQVLDELVLPRPCIFAPHIGYNVEWSQELRVPQSAAEYAKAWLIIHMLASEHGPGLWSGPQMRFDTSVGYDLAGLRTEKVKAYLDTMKDASQLLAALRAQLPPELQRWANVPCPGPISDSVTLSTFHGCPADEIEAIAAQTLDWGWHTVIKLNPTLLGYDRVRAILDGQGYDQIELLPHSFEADLKWAQLVDFIPRLIAKAKEKGLQFGVKFSNTLVCRSAEAPFAEQEMYASGAPLYPLAVELADRFRDAFPELPITFSAGVDAKNLHELVAAGLGPVTSCTDLLKGKGYARMTQHLRGLEQAMAAAGVQSVDALRGVDGGRAALRGLAATAATDPRYHRDQNRSAPKKVGSKLVLMDCLTCDKCIPVCPNGANFQVPLPTGEHRPGALSWEGARFELREGEPLLVAKRHQIGNTADACNLCGHCDTWCPEDGGPYIVKPTLFLSLESYEALTERDGFVLIDGGLRWRRGDVELSWRHVGDEAELETAEGRVFLQGDTPVRTEGRGQVDLRDAVTMRLYETAFRASDRALWG